MPTEHWTEKDQIEELRKEAIALGAFANGGFITSLLVANGGGLLGTVTLIAGTGSGDKARFAEAVSRLPGAGSLFLVGVVLSYLAMLALSVAGALDSTDYQEVLLGKKLFTGEVTRLRLYNTVVLASIISGLLFLVGIGLVSAHLPHIARAGK